MLAIGGFSESWLVITLKRDYIYGFSCLMEQLIKEYHDNLLIVSTQIVG